MPMYNPAHPGALVRGNVEELGWTVTECARKLGVARNTLSRLLNERIGVSPAMALGLEQLGWSDADFWMSLQSAYDLAQERLRREAMERKAKKPARRKTAQRAATSRRRPATTARRRATG